MFSRMCRNFKLFLVGIALTGLLQTSVSAQVSQPVVKSFLIGDHQEFYHELTQKHQSSLLEVCNNSMESSYKEWSLLMKSIEEYADSKGVDIKGSKLWINVFWSKNGKIRYIVFHPKPNSINIDYERVAGIFDDFVEMGFEGKTYSSPYSHYGSISFPVFSHTLSAREK